MNILHVGHSAKWRGGENQARLLIEKAIRIRPDVNHYLAYPSGAVIFDRLSGYSAGNCSLYSKKAFDVRSIYALITFCKANRIDVLHAHSATAHTLSIVVKKFLPALKLIVHRRVDNRIKSRRSTRTKYLSNKVDKFISVSQAITDILVEYGVPDDNIELIYDSIDADVYQGLDKSNNKDEINDKFNWSNETPLIGFISAIDSQKNPELFVDIIKGVTERGVQINAIMAGDGKLKNEIERRINEYGLRDNLKLLGFIKNVETVFSALDIFILPSRNEGLGTVMLEAIAAKAVVVASNVGGISEVVIDQKTGRLINAGDVEEYVNAIIELSKNTEMCRSLVKGAQQHVAGQFNLNNMVVQTLKVYDQVLQT